MCDTDRKKLLEAAEKVRQEVDRAARESAQAIKLINAKSDDFWEWWLKTSPPQQTKEYLPAGPAKKGGGSRTKGRKKKPKKPPLMTERYRLE